MADYLKYPKNRKRYPTEEVDPEHFYTDDDVRKLIKNIKKFKFSQEDYLKVYNCVHCGLCETEMDRIKLKERFLQQGLHLEGLKEMRECFINFRTPYPTNKMRIKRPDGLPKESETLYFMGCLSTIRIPRYTEHSLEYLLKRKINFTILEKEICCGWPWFASGSMKEFEICIKENIEIFNNYNKIICLCPTCYYLFKIYYIPKMKKKIEIVYITDFLTRSDKKKTGTIGVQHLCQLINRGEKGIEKIFEAILIESGYNVVNVPHWCCGGGIGYMHRKDLIEKIAKKRMEDFNNKEIDFITTYCPSCWWILARFSKKFKIKPKAVDPFELLK
ncbi:MAG: (Fe-S)-binding protein [Promethearchaeota archaeon]